MGEGDGSSSAAEIGVRIEESIDAVFVAEVAVEGAAGAGCRGWSLHFVRRKRGSSILVLETWLDTDSLM